VHFNFPTRLNYSFPELRKYNFAFRPNEIVTALLDVFADNVYAEKGLVDKLFNSLPIY